jgi:CMP-2-keto-3-deoxyoctulosonic acid synthetase
MKNKATQDQLITFAKNILSKKKSYVEEILSATEVCEKFNLNRIYLSRSKIPYNPVNGGKKLYLKSEVEFHLIKKEANDYQIQKYGRAYYPN